MGEAYLDLYRDDGSEKISIPGGVAKLEADGLQLVQEEMIFNYEDCLNILDGFARHSTDFLTLEAGACGPAYDVYESVVNYGCFEIVDPLNSVWSGLGAVLLFFVPLLVAVWHIEVTFRSVPAGDSDGDSEGGVEAAVAGERRPSWESAVGAVEEAYAEKY